MKIAIVSDIHGNRSAFEAVLREAQVRGVMRLFVLGDLVGYYYSPDEVMSLLEGWQYDLVQGNHEAMLKEAVRLGAVPVALERRYGHGLRAALEKLSPARVSELTGAPERSSVTVDGIRCLLCHGAPWDRDEYVYPDSPRPVFDRCASSGEDFIFLGHSHYSFVARSGTALVVNPGSVGQSRDTGGEASWAMLDTSNACLTLRSTPYSVIPVVEQARRLDPEMPYLCDVLVRDRGRAGGKAAKAGSE